MSEPSFQLPKLTPMWAAIVIAIPCSAMLALVLCTWIVMGYQRWSVAGVTDQIPALTHAMGEAHQKSVFSTVVVAAILSAPAEKRMAAAEAVCPDEPNVASLHSDVPSPEQTLCATLMTIFKASSPDDATEVIEEVQKTMEDSG